MSNTRHQVITEREINLIGRRLNNSKPLGELIPLLEEAENEGLHITPEQTEKGLSWLLNLWKSPTGKERKNNPFGYREQEVLETFSHFTYDGHIDAGQYNSWYAPIYTVVGKDATFQYYVAGGEIKIIG